MKYLCNKFFYALTGIFVALKSDTGFQLQVIFFFVSSIFLTYFLNPLSVYEILFIGLAYSLLFITELQNSAFEKALDRLHPEIHEHIRESKDIAAGAVLMAFFYFIAVVCGIVFTRTLI